MRLFAEFLFWAGRVESIVALLLVFHLLAIFLLHAKPLTRLLIAGWFILFVFLSATVFYDATLGPVTDGIGYVTEHLYGGLWDDGAAVSGMLQRWQNVLLPVYIPWLTVWAIGLLSILFGSAVHHRAVTRTRPEAPAERLG